MTAAASINSPPAAAAPSYRWNILLLLAASQAIAYIDRVNFAVAGPQLIRVYHYSPAEVGLLISIFNWAFTVSLLGAGPITDRIRPRRSYPLGVGLWSLATALCAITRGFAPLAGFLILLGIGESLMIPSGSRVIRETFPKERRAFAVGTFFAGNKIGLTLGIPLASLLLVQFGWASVFAVTGGLGLAWVLWWIAVYRAPPVNGSLPPLTVSSPVYAGGAERSEAEGGDREVSHIRWAQLLRYPTTWGVMLGQAGYLYIYYVFASWLPGYLVLQRGLTSLNSGIVGMLPFLIGTICVVLGGALGDRLIARGARVTVVRKSFAVGGLFGATLFTLAGAFAAGNIVAIACLTLAVASFSFSTAAVNAMPIDVAPRHIVSSLVSLQNFGGNIGGSFAPVVTGLLLQRTGDFTIPLVVAAVVALVFGCGSYGLIVRNLDAELGKKAA